MKKVAYYITAHGYGHGTRSCDIINALIGKLPTIGRKVPIIVKTDLPLPFLAGRLPLDRITMIQGEFDVGLVQQDSIRVDLDASLRAVEEIYSREEELIQGEVEFIRQNGVGVVVADIPAIPLAAAKRAGVPAIAVGNFGWDWIYSDFVRHDPRWQIHVDKFREAYARTDLLIRIPFAEKMKAFPNKTDVPVLAKPGTNRRMEIADATEAESSKKWVLLSFTTLDWNSQALENIARLTGHEFFSVEPLEWKGSTVHCLDRDRFHFSDVVASCDIVLTKPGFGILSDCVANQKPILYADRENFLEYAVLVKCIEKYLRHAFIPVADLYAGNLETALDEIGTAPTPPETIPLGGAELAVEMILDVLRR
ncbi:MAG: hypothetical protein K9M45_06280 [Kiritimatiellales bacterium]|nr:hypothetical protein [Kiritimatiellales bacterium]